MAMAAATVHLPSELEPHRLRRRVGQVAVALAAATLVVLLAPGLDTLRDALAGAAPGWIALAVLLELLSSLAYVAMFRPTFCRRMSRRRSRQIAWSELAAGSLVPASGATGLALGAWLLHSGGMSTERIARRSVAFFLIKSSVNFVAVAALGAALATGLVGPSLPLWATAVPAALAAAAIAGVLLVPRLGPGAPPAAGAGRLRRATGAGRAALVGGVDEAVGLVRSGDPLVIGGALGYWAFDNLVLWAAFRAVGVTPALSVVLFGYLIGQLGGLLPIPGGVGGIDGGLLGTLILLGTPLAATAGAIVIYRVILFWLPLLGGVPAYAALRRSLARGDAPAVLGTATC